MWHVAFFGLVQLVDSSFCNERPTTAPWKIGAQLRKIVLELIVMEVGDRVVGFLLLLFSITLYSYYTFWVIITPFVDSDHFVHSYFPAREFAIIIPVLAGIGLLSLLLIFVGVVLLRSGKGKAKTA